MNRKVYVRSYQPKPLQEIKPPTHPDLPIEDVDVEYSTEPTWFMEDRSEAEHECSFMRKLNVRDGLHYCDFAVESLASGKFTIVCISHPDYLKLSKDSSTIQ